MGVQVDRRADRRPERAGSGRWPACPPRDNVARWPCAPWPSGLEDQPRSGSWRSSQSRPSPRRPGRAGGPGQPVGLDHADHVTDLDVRAALELGQQVGADVAGADDRGQGLPRGWVRAIVSFLPRDAWWPARRPRRARRTSPTPRSGAPRARTSPGGEPQSALAMTFSRPTGRRKRRCCPRSARDARRSWSRAEQPRQQDLAVGQRRVRQIRHSCWCRGLATSKEYAPALMVSMTGTTSASGCRSAAGRG